MGVRRVAATAGVLTVLLTPAPAHARARHVCDQPPAAAPSVRGQAYQDELYDPDRLAPLATGAGIRVAVIDSGVDATHPLLRGKVLPGRDLLHGDPDGRQDCVGHGTAVAGIIAAGSGSDSSGPEAEAGSEPVIRGLAPGAWIVPVRVSEQERIGDQIEGVQGGSAAFARAIAWAASPGGGRAQVINLSLVTSVDDPGVRQAVADAISAGVVVVAATGNDAQQGNPRPFPAAYPGVIGVGAVGADGVRAAYSQYGDYVDLAAAGDRITVPVPGGGYALGQGTSYAAPFVSATAALMLQRFPGLGPAQVARRLIATADPAPGGARSGGYGYGLLNPYRALTESLGSDRPVAAAPVVPTAPDPAMLAERARRASARDEALTVAGVGGGVVVLAALLAAVARRGRRRGWRPGRAVRG